MESVSKMPPQHIDSDKLTGLYEALIVLATAGIGWISTRIRRDKTTNQPSVDALLDSGAGTVTIRASTAGYTIAPGTVAAGAKTTYVCTNYRDWKAMI